MSGAYPNDQSLLRVAVCIMMDINEDWVTGNRYFILRGVSRIWIQGHCEFYSNCGTLPANSSIGKVYLEVIPLRSHNREDWYC